MNPVNSIMKYFEYKHLPEKLQDVSVGFYHLAWSMENHLSDGPEKSAGLRKLLEAKDCMVRAALETKGDLIWENQATGA